jgi:micrococcal nuclease
LERTIGGPIADLTFETRNVFTFAAKILPVLLALAALTACDSGAATVQEVIDGDTIDVVADGHELRVRLLNIAAPESVDPNRPVECLGPEASAFLENLLPVGTAVRLEFDVERADRYGRALAGVYLGDRLVNAEIAREGLGFAEVVGDNRRFYGEVLAASLDAQQQRKGLFDPAAECTIAARISDFEARVATATASPPATGASAVFDQYGLALGQLAGDAEQLLASIDTGDISVRVWGADAVTLLTERTEKAAEQVDVAARKSAEARRVMEAEEARKAAEEQAARDAARRKADADAAASRDSARRQAEADADRRQESGQSSGGSGSGGTSTGRSGSAGTGDKYTGCRAYGPKGTSVDDKGRRYTKIDCTTKQPI